jgi:hypothetical protein
MSLLNKYISCLQRRPILTKSITAGVLNGLQEIIATLATGSYSQGWFHKALSLSIYGKLFITSGSLVSAPASHYLYISLEKVFRGKSGYLIDVLKLLYGNLIISPILTWFYLVALAKIAGNSLERATRLAKDKLYSTMKIAWTINPIAQTIAFQVFLF